MDRIARDPTTVVCPVIDVISDDTFEYMHHQSSNVNVGGFDWMLQFSWHAIPDREAKKHSHRSEPVYSPTMAGGLFSIDRAFFEKLGTYDPDFDIWGGENLELSFKVGTLFINAIYQIFMFCMKYTITYNLLKLWMKYVKYLLSINDHSLYMYIYVK